MGYSINEKKQVFIALTAIYGVGISTAKQLCRNLKIEDSTRVTELTPEQVNNINNLIRKQEIKISDDLKKEVANNIRELMEIKSYRGKRLSRGLPCRGQRTHSNGQTARKIKNYKN